MNKWSVLFFCFFAFLIFGCSNEGTAKFDPKKPSAKIVQIEGSAQWRKNPTLDWLEAQVNQMLFPYQLVKTLKEGEKKGSAVLVFIDNSRVSLEPGSQLEITQIYPKDEKQSFFDITVKVVTGLTLFEVEHHGKKREFIVETESAITAVTGTTFTVEVKPDGTTRVVVKKGSVEVTGNGKRVSVKPSYVTTVEKRKTPAEPVAVNLKGETIFEKNIRDIGTLKR